MSQHNPQHPGEVLEGLYLEPAKVTKELLAKHLGVTRTTVSRLVNAHTSITVDMAVRLARVFSTTPQLWLNMQNSYDLWQSEKNNSKKLKWVIPFRPEELNMAAHLIQ
jgi:addiction module HigA family antidote